MEQTNSKSNELSVIHSPPSSPLSFDFERVPAEIRESVRTKTDLVRDRFAKSTEQILEIGRLIFEVKGCLAHGLFQDWVRTLGLSPDTAERWMNAHKAFGEKPQAAVFTPMALYALAAPKAPQAARVEAVRLAAAGQPITEKIAKQLIKDYRSGGTGKPQATPAERLQTPKPVDSVLIGFLKRVLAMDLSGSAADEMTSWFRTEFREAGRKRKIKLVHQIHVIRGAFNQMLMTTEGSLSATTERRSDPDAVMDAGGPAVSAQDTATNE